ncbi:MAG: HAD-IIIA family hydrolase [Candidatus Taylorbacteria bacterium]|nr:HAD-IIIA family hydrolase [Candidatus Taylorbacteria bacterium]
MFARKKRAIFLDRDGIINELRYDPEYGVIESPLNTAQVRLVFGIVPLLKWAKKLGYLLIIISNQPNLALAKTSEANFARISRKIKGLLKKEAVTIDAEYYCFHHPFAKVKKFRKKCDCRKPGVGLFLEAAKEHDIDLNSSWTIGDGVADVLAGKAAGCKTMLLANIDAAENLRIIERQLGDIKPDFIIKKLTDAVPLIKRSR